MHFIPLQEYSGRHRRFAKWLAGQLGKTVEIRFNRNRTVFLSVEHKEGRLKVSVHECFVEASDAMLAALVDYVERHSKDARRKLQEYFETWCQTAESHAPRRRILRARGKTYDLHRIYCELNSKYFHSSLKLAITWGRSTAIHPKRRRIVFGTYDHHQRLIRIHPLLDSRHVPAYFVEFVVYHEMLHAYLEPEKDADGRRRIHTPTFRALESAFAEYELAQKFEKEFWKQMGQFGPRTKLGAQNA